MVLFVSDEEVVIDINANSKEKLSRGVSPFRLVDDVLQTSDELSVPRPSRFEIAGFWSSF